MIGVKARTGCAALSQSSSLQLGTLVRVFQPLSLSSPGVVLLLPHSPPPLAPVPPLFPLILFPLTLTRCSLGADKSGASIPHLSPTDTFPGGGGGDLVPSHPSDVFADISSLPQDALLSPMCFLIVGPRRSCKRCHREFLLLDFIATIVIFPAKSFSGQQLGLECNMAFIQQSHKLYFSGVVTTGLDWAALDCIGLDWTALHWWWLGDQPFVPVCSKLRTDGEEIVSPQFVMRVTPRTIGTNL